MKKIGLLIAFVFCTINVFAQPNIKVTNSDYKNYYLTGNTNTYTITVVNTGSANATNVSVSNPIPAGISSFSWSGGPNGAAGVNKPLNDVIATLAIGAVASYTVVIQVPTTYSVPLVNTVNITAANATSVSATDTDIKSNADVVISNTDGLVKYTPGGTNIYTVTIANNGPGAVSNVIVQDVFTTGLNITWTGNNHNGTGDLNDTIGNLPPATSVVYTVTVNIPANFTGDITGTATANQSGAISQAIDTDVQTGQNYASLTADINANKTDNKTTFLYGGSNTYTVVVTNKGPDAAKNVVVSDPKPLGITDMSWYGNNGTSGTGDLNDIIPTLAVGDVVVYTVTIQIPTNYGPVDPTNPGQTIKNITNSVKLSSDSTDPAINCPGCIDLDTPAVNYVTVDSTKYTVPQLVNDVLINSPCVTGTNFSFSPSCGYGYFNKQNSSFPIKEGVIIRSGIAKGTEGIWDTANMNNNNYSTVCSNATDADLKAIVSAAGNAGSINDTSFIKFNFLAGGPDFTFNYLFASNEYGAYQCQYSDAFAFILTDLTAGTPSQNLAVLPGTNIPVSVTTIRNSKYNPKCGDANVQYFGQYNPGNPNGAIKMQGQTIKLTASANIIAGHNYSIKLVIGDYVDTAMDSSVFIEAGSFHFGGPQPVGTGENIGQTEISLCPGSTADIQSGSTVLPNVIYSWRRNGVLIPGATTNKITVSQDGIYSVTYTYNTGCEQSASIPVTYTSGNTYQQPIDLKICDYPGETFDLTVNEPIVLGGQNPQNYYISYFHSQIDADNGDPGQNPITDTNKRTYNGQDGEEVFMRIELGSQNCYAVKSFKLFRIPPPPVPVFNYGQPSFCPGASTSVSVVKQQPFPEGGTYQVVPPTGLLVDQNTGALDLTGAKPGLYTVTYSPPNVGCTPKDGSVDLLIGFCSVMNPILPVCAGDPVVLSCTDAGSGITYTWLDKDNNVLATTTVPTYTIPSSPLVAGNYQYSVVASYDIYQSTPSSQTLTVNPIPKASITGTTSICSGGSAVVNFSGTPNAFVTYNDGAANLTVQLDSTGAYQLTASNLVSDVTYQLVSVAGNTTPNCLQNIPNTAPNSSVTITVISAPTASITFGSNSTICEGQATDVVFNGTPNAVVVYTKNGVDQNVTLNASGQPTIVNTGVLSSDTVFTIVSVTSSGATCVGYPSGPDSTLTIAVVQIPQPAMKQKAYICQDPTTGVTTRTYTLQTGLDSATYDFAWFQGGVMISGATQSSYDADAVAQFKVVVTDKVSGCTTTATTDVFASIPPTAVLASVSTTYFADNATVVVTATPVAPTGVTYEYSLDFGPYQDSNVFEGVSSGNHEVHVRDKEACAVLTTTVTVIDFPKYFTPNADGYNDTWNIPSLNDQTNSKIYIFDRFGKLLKQISPAGPGWDGTYNGQQMPADDYWFVVKYQEHLIDQEFKSHFSLKR